MLTKRRLQNLTSMFEMLGQSVRLRILDELTRRGEVDVMTLCRRLHLPQPTASHHLALLRVHGLITGRRDGKRKLYVLNRPALDDAKRFLYETGVVGARQAGKGGRARKRG